MTGVGLGPESSGALGVSGVLGDREGLRVAGVSSVELRSSFVTAGVATAGVATAGVLAEAQQFRNTSRSDGRLHGPMAEHSIPRPEPRPVSCRATDTAKREE